MAETKSGLRAKSIHMESKRSNATPMNVRERARQGRGPLWRTGLSAAVSMIAFAANSLLCRLALKTTGIDAASFTTIRLFAGAAVLWPVLRARRTGLSAAGSWPSAGALFVYAAAFSFAYGKLPAATGALVLFGSVQATMIGYGLLAGERLRGWQVVGLCVSAGGLIWLLLPGLSAPSPAGAGLMVGAGVAWSIYSLRGREAADAVAATAGNFLRTVPFAGLLSLVLLAGASPTVAGVWCAVVSGAVTSGLGYVVWYSVLPRLPATNAAVIQLSVPVLAALGGVGLLSEPLTPRLLGAAVAILGGIAVVISARR